MVPMGIDRWASAKSPERLQPAMIPYQNPLGIVFFNDNEMWTLFFSFLCTSNAGEVDANQ